MHSNILYIWITNILIMNFSLSEEHLMVREAARDFAQTELRPGVIERDELQEFPDNLVKKMGALGFMGIMVDPKYGGSGMDTISYVLDYGRTFKSRCLGIGDCIGQ